jgi:hypothetical protein
MKTRATSPRTLLIPSAAAFLLLGPGSAPAGAQSGSNPPLVAGPTAGGPRDQANAVQRMFVDDRPVRPDVNPQIIKGKMMVPVRFVSEYLRIKTDWKTGQRRATFTTNAPVRRTIVMTAGSTRASLNGEGRALETAPVVREGRLFIPLRDVERFFGAQVVYNPRNQTVFVKTARDSTQPSGAAAQGGVGGAGNNSTGGAGGNTSPPQR